MDWLIETTWLLLQIVLLVGGLGLLAFFFVLILSGHKKQAAVLEVATTTFVTRGDSVHAILPNISGFELSEETDLSGRQWIVPIERSVPKDSKNPPDVPSDGIESYIQRNSSWWPSRRIAMFLWTRFGIKWISIWYPKIKIHEINLGKRGRLHIRSGHEASVQEEKKLELRDRIEKSSEEGPVSSLLFIVPRPIYMGDVELGGDNSKINILLLARLRQVIPTIPVFDLKGNFFDLLDSAVQAIVLDFFASHRVAVHKKDIDDENLEGTFADDWYNEEDENHRKKYNSAPLTYSHWVRLKKVGIDSSIERHIFKNHVNISLDGLERLRQHLSKNHANTSPDGLEQSKSDEFTGLAKYAKDEFARDFKTSVAEPASSESSHDMAVKSASPEMPHGMIEAFGFGLLTLRIIDWEPSKETQDLSKAMLEKEINRKKAQGVREKSYGVRDAAIAVAAGEHARFTALIKAQVEQGVPRDVAARVVETYLRMDGLAKSTGLTTYVEGGSRSSIMIPAQQANADKSGDQKGEQK